MFHNIQFNNWILVKCLALWDPHRIEIWWSFQIWLSFWMATPCDWLQCFAPEVSLFELITNTLPPPSSPLPTSPPSSPPPLSFCYHHLTHPPPLSSLPLPPPLFSLPLPPPLFSLPLPPPHLPYQHQHHLYMCDPTTTTHVPAMLPLPLSKPHHHHNCKKDWRLLFSCRNCARCTDFCCTAVWSRKTTVCC